jgi:hypothetical protein
MAPKVPHPPQALVSLRIAPVLKPPHSPRVGNSEIARKLPALLGLGRMGNPEPRNLGPGADKANASSNWRLYPFGCFPSDSLIVFGMMPCVFSIRTMAAGVIALPLDHVSQGRSMRSTRSATSSVHETRSAALPPFFSRPSNTRRMSPSSITPRDRSSCSAPFAERASDAARAMCGQ